MRARSGPRLQDFLTSANLAELDRSAAQACGLPGVCYRAPQFLELEQRDLFGHGWVVAAVASQIPEAGDVLPVTVAGRHLVFTRDPHGHVHCLHNICRHRGAAVVMAPSSGNVALRCPWHGWHYGLDGTLRGTPEFGGVDTHGVAAVKPAEHGLIPVRVECWLDFLFVSFDAEAPPLADWLAPLAARFQHLELSRFQYAQSWQYRYACNWKIAIEGAIEDYHLSSVHPELTVAGRRGDASRVEYVPGCYYAVATELESYASGRGAASGATLPCLAPVAGPDNNASYFVSVFPSGVLGFARDYLYAGVWLPDGAESTVLDIHFYFLDDAAADPRYLRARKRLMAAITEVFEQDAPIVAAVQRRTAERDRLGIRTRFSPFWESAVQQFQRDVVATLRAHP